MSEHHVRVDVPVAVQHQCLGAAGQLGDVLRNHEVQPGKPLRPADPQELAVRAVHHGDAASRRALLGERVSPVPRHALLGISIRRGDRTLHFEKR